MSAWGWEAWLRVVREDDDCGGLVGTRAMLALLLRLVVRVGATADPGKSTGGELLQDRAKGLPKVCGMEVLESVGVVTDEASEREAGGATVTTPPPTATLAPGS